MARALARRIPMRKGEREKDKADTLPKPETRGSFDSACLFPSHVSPHNVSTEPWSGLVQR
jgi:hypothetical protein